MDYRKHYIKLCESRKKRGLDKTILNDYYETHHILPKCMGGLDDKDNLVLLTGREHYIAHWLLTKMYPQNRSLLFAFGSFQTREKTSKRVERAKLKWREVNNDLHPWKGKTLSEKHKSKISKSKRGQGYLSRCPTRYTSIFHWLNVQTGEEEFCMSCDLIRNYGLDNAATSRVVRGIQSEHKGWVILDQV